ncbi:aspartate/glutamate racemase family protein [Nesterenkonia sp. HG001]|uniref:maleate cis-trans isomerase family protein n=1 Tax=Nesterenkonia sp. HG001 TaxID=2983207 RepID=UPI002AC67AB3|nr:aspartate/glutamate racemase family protein [Nesterenkonia sp. HG001]MDZ5077645.1 aspartate/glutamate racemase family protein [Nesterenkonia sp. HG001]
MALTPFPGSDRMAPAIGVVVPYDMALDRELRTFTQDADGVEQLDLLFTRTRHEPLAVTVKQARAISRPKAIADCVRSVSAVTPSAYLYACTSGSFVRGISGEHDLVRAMTDAGEAPCFTTSGALLAAVQALGVRTLATATPYDDAITAQFAAFFAESGIHLMSNSNLGLSGRIWEVPSQRTYDLVREADSDQAEAVVVSCTNLPTYDVLAQLEQDLGKPVISANQATVWAVLQHFGLPYHGPGRALARQEPSAAVV